MSVNRCVECGRVSLLIRGMCSTCRLQDEIRQAADDAAREKDRDE